MLINSPLSAVGNVPLIRLNKLSSGNVYAKAEFLNPGGSIKDRVAKYIIETAEGRGELAPGQTIIEATSGNTGIGLALVGVLIVLFAVTTAANTALAEDAGLLEGNLKTEVTTSN